MESRWYFLPGQTLQNTKIDNRSRALHISAGKFENITRHCERKRIIQEEEDMKESKRKYLEEGKNMTKQWDNSIESITKTKKAEQLRKKEAIKAEYVQEFFTIRKEQEAIHKECVDKIRKQIFKKKPFSRELTTAFMLTEVLNERKQQIELKKISKGLEDEQEVKFAELVKENVKQEVVENEERAKNLYGKKKEYGKYLKSIWFLFPGQTLENTKIEDRGHALHITADAYGKIRRHFDRNKGIQEMLEKEENKRKYLEEGSKNMTKNWDNSVENITKRKEEARLNRIEFNKADKLQRFYNIRKDQQAFREKYVQKVKARMFRNIGMSRDIASAFRLSEVLYEREKQKEFKAFIKAHEDEEDAEYAENVKKNAKAEFEEKKEYARKLYENKKQYGKYLTSVMEENAAKEKQIKETSKLKEIEDNKRSIEEMALIKKKEQEKAFLKKKELKLDLQKHLNAERERQLLLEEEEKEKDEVVEIYQQAKHRIDCLKKDKEKELQDAIIERRGAVAKLVVAGEAARNAAEEKSLQKALAERDAMEKIQREKKERYLARMQRERLEDRERCILRENEEQKRDAERKKWAMINRYKNDDISQAYERNRKQEQWNKILQYRKVLLDQMAENDRERLREKEIDDFNKVQSYDVEDAKFFDYADEVLELAKKTGRSTYPIEKVIVAYKTLNKIKAPVCVQGTCEDYFTSGGPNKSQSREIANAIRNTCPCKCNNQK